MRRFMLMVLFLPTLAVAADSWPQWNGPNRDGISAEKGLLKTWPKEGPALVWTFDNAGTGFSAPAAVDGTLYLTGARKETEYLFALDSQGKELWATPIGPIYDFKGNQWSGGPNGSPSVDKDSIVTLGSQGILLCTDRKGTKRWALDLVASLGAEVNDVQSPVKSPAWGFCWSPILDGDQVLITPGGNQGLVAALDKKTGKVLWQSKEIKEPCTYASAVLATIGDVKHLVAIVQNGAVGVSTRDGSVLWRYQRVNYPDIVATSPVVFKNQVYLTAGWNGGSTLLEITQEGGKFVAKEIYAKKEIGNKQGGVVLLNGSLYGFHEDRAWNCQDWATGKINWESNRRGFPVGSIISADDLIFIQGEQGDVGLLAASPTKYELKSRFKLPRETTLRKPSGRVWTHPVIADGLLYLRDQDLVFCYKVK